MFKETTSVLTPLVSSVSVHSIWDCIRLGRFLPDCQTPRPILVKLNSTSEVSAILSNRKLLSDFPGVSIKPHLSRSQLQVEKMLLVKRRSLISSGAEPKDIKIRRNQLFHGTKLVGSVEDFKFLDAISADNLNLPNPASPISAPPISDTHVVTAPIIAPIATLILLLLLLN